MSGGFDLRSSLAVCWLLGPTTFPAAKLRSSRLHALLSILTMLCVVGVAADGCKPSPQAGGCLFNATAADASNQTLSEHLAYNTTSLQGAAAGACKPPATLSQQPPSTEHQHQQAAPLLGESGRNSPLVAAVLMTSATTAACLMLQLVTGCIVDFLHRMGACQRTHRLPPSSKLHLLTVDVVGAVCYMAPAAFLQAYWPMKWSYAPPNFFLLGFWSLAGTHFIDTYYYFLHRWFHSNKLVFKIFHARHHSPQSNLSIESTFYLDPLGALLEGGLPAAAYCLITYLVVGNAWYYMAIMLQTVYIALVGHTGVDVQFKHPAELLLIAPNPFALWYAMSPCMNVPSDHEAHHRDPRTNFGPYFSFLDGIMGTKSGKHDRPCTPLLLAASLLYMVAFFGGLQLLLTHPLHTVLVYLVAYVATPPALSAAVFDALRVPQAVRWAAGSVIDAYRRHCGVEYAEPGQLGSFVTDSQQAASSSRTRSTHAASPTYIFACHPTGVLSRGALLTFAARGWTSPVSGLARVRLAVGSALFRLPIPFSREALLALGCVPADKAVLQQQLRAGTSVAITPGGWREPTHTCAYDLLLKGRTGFVQLALDTGSQLVPVLCLGEHLVMAAPIFLTLPASVQASCLGQFNWVRRLLIGADRDEAVRVVFGVPLVPQKGEDVMQLHARYTAALLALAEQHGVSLNIM